MLYSIYYTILNENDVCLSASCTKLLPSPQGPPIIANHPRWDTPIFLLVHTVSVGTNINKPIYCYHFTPPSPQGQLTNDLLLMSPQGLIC
jgi:hypothetical protein